MELGWSPDRVFAQSTSWFAKWEAYFKKRPFGQAVIHQMLAFMTSYMVNVNLPEGHDLTKAEDFVPGYGELDEDKDYDPEEDQDLLRQQAAWMANQNRETLARLEEETGIKFTASKKERTVIPQPGQRKPGQGLPKLK